MKYSNLLAVLILLPFFLLTAFRGAEVGVDTMAYFFEYEGDVYRSTEFIYSFIIKFLNGLGMSFGGFLILLASLYYFSLYVLFQRVDVGSGYVYAIFVVVFIMFAFGLSGIRQSIAISFFLLSIHYLVKRNYLIFFVFGFFATFVHNSAFIAFMLIFLFSFVRLNLNRTFFLCLISPIFVSLIESYLLKLNILPQYSIYFETEKGILNFKLPLLWWGVVLVLLSTFLFGSKLKAFNSGYRKALVDRIDARYLNIIMWSIVFSVYFFWAGMSLSTVARLSFYYIPFVAIYSAILFSLGNNHGFVIFKYFFISFLILIFPILNKNEVAMLLSYYLNY